MTEQLAVRPVPGAWTLVPAARGAGSLLVRFDRGQALIAAPPAVRLGPGEGPEELLHWRVRGGPIGDGDWLSPRVVATWASGSDVIDTALLLRLLPDHLHPWVEGVMRSQLSQCEAFSRSQPGMLQREERARAAAQRRLALLRELHAAFPDVDVDGAAPKIPAVPETGDALLRAMHGVMEFGWPTRALLRMRRWQPRSALGRAVRTIGSGTVRHTPLRRWLPPPGARRVGQLAVRARIS